MENRRTVLKYIAGAAGASVCGIDTLESFAQGLQPSAKKPNIVCIVGEGLRWDELSSTGNKIIKTPNMDRIGREGCIFNNAFVVNALCLPSRATMLTGMYSHTTGAVSNVEGKIPARFPLVSDMLQQAGYETAFLGKSHIEGALMDHPWDYYFGFVGQADYYRSRHHGGSARQVRSGQTLRGRIRRHAADAQGGRVAAAEARQTVLPVPLVLCAACAVLPAQGHGERFERGCHSQAIDVR